MKLKIYQETEKREKVEEPVRLRLIKSHGQIQVVAVDREGKPVPQGYLLSFASDGKLRRHSLVSTELGFDLGRGDKIKIQS